MRSLTKTAGLCAASTLCALLAGAPARAFAAPQDEGAGGEEGAASEEAAESEEADEKENHYFAVIGGDVYTGTGEVLRGATVLAKNGRITAVGYDVELPGIDYFADVPKEERKFDLETLDAAGLRVYPGIVAISSSSLLGTSSDFEDATDPFSQNLVLGLATGITSTGSSRSAVKLKRYVSHDPPRPFDFKEVVLRETTYATMSWSTSNPSSKRSLREKLEAASKYLRKYRQWETDVKKDKELKEPSKKGVDSSVLSVLKGEVFARFNADGREDLLGIALLAQEFGFRPIIDGCREGWTVADELGRAGAMAIVTPRSRRDKDERLVRPGGSSIENASLLHAAGVPVAIAAQSGGINLGGIVGRDIMHLPVEVGFAVRGGLPEGAALDALWRTPARMMGIGHRVGSLEVGKDCDLIVTDGDILHYQTFVQYTVVDGELVYDKEQELFFAHIRPRPASELAPETKVDAGENPPAEDPAVEGEEGDEGEGEEGDEGEGEGGDGEDEGGDGDDGGEGGDGDGR